MISSDEENGPLTSVQKALGLITNPAISISDVFTHELTCALFINKNKKLLFAFQTRLEDEMIQTSLLVEPRHQIEAKIDNILSFIAYTEPENSRTIKIPTFTNDCFELIDHTVQRINLTPDCVSAPYTCYGLIPNTLSATQSRLVFMGTTFPTAKGFAQALLGDTAPGGGVGHYLYAQGKNYLQQWINRQYERSSLPVHCCGQSLGGAMAMQTYLHQPDKVEFTAINPPFLTHAEEKALEECTINQSAWVSSNQIYSHTLDPISEIGHWFPPLTRVCIHGSENDFSGSRLHQYFKAHASQLNTDSFIQYNGEDYLNTLKSQRLRMVKHYALKPIRAAAFATFFTVIAATSVPRAIGKASGLISTQKKGPQALLENNDENGIQATL